MYTSTFSDWFCQAVIDFMLGHRTLSVFSEFLLKLQSTDPRELIRLSKIRAEAIVTCVSRVLPEGERLLSGWTVFAPEHLNTKSGEKFEEKVLLLVGETLAEDCSLLIDLVQTAQALYIIVRKPSPNDMHLLIRLRRVTIIPWIRSRFIPVFPWGTLL
jgi:hypothetical protein